MRIGNPQDINGNPLLINVSVDNNYITGNGTSSNVLTFAGFPVYNTNGTIVVNKVKSIKAGEGISFSSDANQLIINANPVTDISDSIVKVININSTDNKVPTAKTVYNFVTSNFIQLINGKINNELINKADTLNYGIVKIGQGINVESGIISVPTIATTIANNITNPVAGNVIYNALETKLNKPTAGGQYGKVLSYKNNTQNVWIDITIPKIVSKFPQNLGNAGQILKVSNNATTLEWSNLESLSIDGSITSNGENAVKGSAVYQFVNSHASDMALHLPSGGTSGQILTKSNNNIVWDDPVKIDNQITSDSENAVAVNVVYNALQGKIDKPILINAAGYVLTVNNDENGFVVNPIDNVLNGNSINAVQNKTVYSALQTKADSSDLNNYATELEFDINSQNYVISAVLKNNNVILTSRTIDLPLQTMVVSASYQSATKNLILTLKNNETVSCSISDIIDGLVPDNRTINNKALNDDINIYATDIKLNNQVNAKTISALFDEKGDMFLSDYVNQGGQGIVLSANNANYAISAGNIEWNNVNGKPSEFNPISHNHNISDINEFNSNVSSIISGMIEGIDANNAQFASNANYANSAGNIEWSNVNGKPSEFEPTSHNHNISDINNFDGSVSSIVSIMIEDIDVNNAQFASNANFANSANIANYASTVGQHQHNISDINEFDGNVSSIVSGMIENISADIAQIASSAGYASKAQIAQFASNAGYAQEVGQHNHNTVQITDFDSSVSSIVSIMIEGIDANNAQFASSANIANHASNADVANYAISAGYAQEVGQHNHNTVQITDFDSSVSSIVSGIIENIDVNNAQFASNANYAISAGNVEWNNVNGKPSEFNPVSHNHNILDINNFDGNVSSIVSIMIEDIDANNAQFASSANYANSADVAEYASNADIANYASNAEYANNIEWININNKPSKFDPISHSHNVSDINEFNGNVSSIVSGMIEGIDANNAQFASSANYASSAGYAQEVGQHNHSSVQITDFNGNVSSIVSGMIENISADIAQIASSAGYASKAQIAQYASNAQFASGANIAEYATSAGYAQEVGQHNHNVSDINNFNGNVSSIISGMIQNISADIAQIASNANHASNADIAQFANSAGNIEWNNVNGKPSEFNPISHNHNVSDINGIENITVLSAINADIANSAYNIDWDEIKGKPSSLYNEQVFSNKVSSILTGMFLDSTTVIVNTSNALYANEAGYATSAGNVKWRDVNGKPSKFDPISHNHNISDINEFNGNVSSIVSGMIENIDANNAKYAQIAEFASNADIAQYASSAQFASNADIAQFASSAGNIEWNNVNGKPSEFNPISHNHNVSDINDIENITVLSANYASSAGNIEWNDITNKSIATTSSLGLVKIGRGLEIDEFGSVNININTTKQINITKENSEQITWSTINQYGNNRYICKVQHNMNGYIFIQLFDNNGYGVPIIPYYIDENNIAFYIEEKPQNNETYKLICLSSGCSSNNNKNKSFNFTFLNSNYVTWNGNKATFIHNMNCIPIVTIYNNDKKQVFLSVEIIDANTIAVDFEKVISDTWKIIFTYGTEYDYN